MFEEQAFVKIPVLGGSVDLNVPYTNKKNQEKEAGVRVSGFSQYPISLPKSVIEAIWALKENQDFMLKVYPNMK